MSAKDYTGQRFGRLIVEFRAGKSKHGGNLIWRCKCDCGNTKDVLSTLLRKGETRSCGCLQREQSVVRATKHGHATGKTTRTYNSWASMLARCRNQDHPEYPDYGGRGITVCERWHSFENFLADMGERPIGRTIDRANNDGNYEPGNCRWATPKEQTDNRRPRKDSKRHLMATVHGIHIIEIRQKK